MIKTISAFIKAKFQYGGNEITVPFPITESMLSAKLTELHAPSETSELFLTEIEFPTELKALENTFVNIDELNFLGKRMEGFCEDEDFQLFEAMKLEGFTRLKDIINLSFNLDKYTWIYDGGNNALFCTEWDDLAPNDNAKIQFYGLMEDCDGSLDFSAEWAYKCIKGAQGIWNDSAYLCTNPPYGYLKDPDNKKRWIVDEEAAKVVEDIFSLCVAGNGPSQIARILKNQQVDTPTIHYQKIGKTIKNCLPMNDYDWDQKTVSEILERPEYLGQTVNFKTHKQSYKIKKTVDNPKDQWRIFPNTHEPIVDEETFNRVQELRKNKRRPTRTGKTNMFSGIVRCADCKEKMYYCTTKNFEKRQDHFVCSTSRTKGKEVCGTHFIRAVILEQGVLHHIRTVMWLVANHEEKFRAALGAMQKSEMKKALASKKKQVNQIERRIDELDRLFKKVYEDYANQRLSEARYEMLSGDYEAEQAELREKLETLTAEIEQQEEQAENIDKFIAKVKKYLDMAELTPAILNDLVKAVYVHKPKKVDGKRVVDIDISYDFVGILPKHLFEEMKNEPMP